MEIPLQARVECADGVCGRSMYVLINPAVEKVTHLVVKESSSNTEYIVPVDVVSETIADVIQLRCSKAELKKMEPFIETRFVEEQVPDMALGYGYGMGSYYYWPYVRPERTVQVPVESQHIPAGELAVHRGDRVEATDGPVGQVDEFVVDPETDQITHLILREGHLWGRKDVMIPRSALDDTRHSAVFLKLDKRQIEALPTFPVRRRWA